MAKNILLIDLSSLLYPIFHMSGNEPDVNHTANYTVARVHELAHGFDHVAVCCDSPGKTFRHDLSAEYKANRIERDERLIHQLKLAQEKLKADGFPVWAVPGFEADDIVATATTKALDDPEAEIMIASSDKDLTQLVGERVLQKSLTTGNVLDPIGVREKFGVGPGQMRDWLILVGDSTDNIKGVPGIGQKRATDLLNQHGSLSNVFAELSHSPTSPTMTPSVRKALTESIISIETTRKLVELRRDVAIPFEELFKPRKAKPISEEETDDMETIDEETGEVVEQVQAPQGEQVKIEAPPMVQTIAEPKVISAELVKVDWNMGLEPRSIDEAARVAKILFESRLFSAYGSAQAVFASIMTGRELGIGTTASLRGIHIIEGKPSMSSDLMAALILRSPKCKYFRCVKSTREEATYTTMRIGHDMPTTVTFSIEDAKLAQLIRPRSGWEKYPADMLRARAVARLARMVYPDICFGLYTAEELGREDLEPSEAA